MKKDLAIDGGVVDVPAMETIGGDAGAPNDLQLSGTAWQLVAGTDVDEFGHVETLEHLEHLLAASPEMAGPALLGALVRLRAALQQLPRDADASHPVVVPAVDAVMLSRSVLRGLR